MHYFNGHFPHNSGFAVAPLILSLS